MKSIASPLWTYLGVLSAFLVLVLLIAGWRSTPPEPRASSPSSLDAPISLASWVAGNSAEPQDEETDRDGEGDEPSFTDEQVEHFEKNVRPILEEHCFKCHGKGEKLMGGLNLTFRNGLLEGGDSGAAIDLESPELSLLVESINYESYEMPPEGQLPDDQIAILTDWIEGGAAWTPGDMGSQPTEHVGMAPPVNEETKSFWSFQRVERPALPDVDQEDWVRNPIDRFILAKLEAADLKPSKTADKQTLIRRAYYDVLGLPPSPEEVKAFLDDDSSDAYEAMVDRLLASPHYGERWARHWLDLVRYAETNSYERDGAKPFVWKYRDYVIRAFNEDKPYDQFVIEQLAGDELPEVTPESIIATGYYRLGRWDDEPVDQKQAFYDDLDDIMMTTSQSFLGLTVNCARCHDHKIDPVPQKDYYRLLSFFENIKRYGVRSHDSVMAASIRDIASPEERQQYQGEVAEYEQQVATNQKALEALEAKVKGDFIPVEHEEFKHERNRVALIRKRIGSLITEEDGDQYEALTRERNRLRGQRPAALAQALCVREHGADPKESFVLIRGSANAPGEAITPGFLSVLDPPEPVIKAPEHGESSGRRLALARWLVDGENPMTARVMVNRLWQHHFGRGIVRSSNDFGFQGTAPTHPELLDWLAAEFVDGDWKIKRLHKLIMMSSTYRMSSQGDEAALTKDPTNDLFWRFDMRRLTAEEIRDSVLAVNHSLNTESMYGPSIYTDIPAEVKAGQSRPGSGWGNSSEADKRRRSIYIHVKRSLIEPTLEVFDFADTDSTCPVRFVTTQPTQALAMMNSEFINRQAMVFAEYLSSEHPNSTATQVEHGLWRVMQRQPNAQEVERGVKLIGSLRERDDIDDAKALEYFCLVALNLNEFLYLD